MSALVPAAPPVRGLGGRVKNIIDKHVGAVHTLLMKTTTNPGDVVKASAARLAAAADAKEGAKQEAMFAKIEMRKARSWFREASNRRLNPAKWG